METPLREPTFLILTALAAEPLHGYGLIAEVVRLSDNRITLRPGTLYGALDRLSDAGLVTVDREETVDGRLRRYYRLSERGAGILTEETERMRRNVDAASARLRAWTAPAPGRTPGLTSLIATLTGITSTAWITAKAGIAGKASRTGIANMTGIAGQTGATRNTGLTGLSMPRRRLATRRMPRPDGEMA